MLELFDRHLLAFGKELAATAAALDPETRIQPPRKLDPQLRGIILQALNKCREPWRAALDRIFDTNNLSRARRVEAIRHLSSLSHWTLLHMAVELRYDLSTFAGNEQGVLADQMAASLLNLTGQNFQTTRDHIAYLISLGLLERQPGKSLRVALSDSVAAEFHRALSAAAAALPEVARSIAALQPASPGGRRCGSRCPGNAQPAIGQCAAPGEVGATAPSGDPAAGVLGTPRRLAGWFVDDRPRATQRLLLEGAEVSRTHCRIDVADGEASVTDLNSTNGTFLDNKRLTATAALSHGALLRIGNYVLTCEYQRDLAFEEADSTQRKPSGLADVAILRPRRSKAS